MRIKKWHNKLGLLLIASLSLKPFLLYAESSLTLQELTQLAINCNKDIKSSRYAIAIAHGRLAQAGLWPNPSLELSNNDDRLFKDEGEYSRSIGFSQALPISGRIAQQKTIACIDIERAKSEVREAMRQLSSKVANAYYSLVITENRIQQLSYLLRINKELVHVIHDRYHAAEVSELDDNSAKIEFARIQQEKQLLKSQLINQYTTLNQLIGRNPRSSLRIKTSIEIAKRLPSLHDLINQALHHRPDRQGFILAEQKSIADKNLAKAERFADWTLGVGVQQEKIVVEGAPPQQADKTLNLTLSVPLPLLNRNQGRILETSATRTQALMAIDALNLTIETEVVSNYGQVKALRTSLLQTQSTALRLSVANIKLAREAYQNGQMSLLNVLQVQRQQNELQMAYLTTVEKYFQSYVALCTAVAYSSPKGLCSYLSSAKETIK